MKAQDLKPGRYQGGTLVSAALETAGITHTFGIPGTHNIELYDCLAHSDILPVLITDEQSSGFLADGMARSGGPIGCANVVPGAGLTHALSGVGETLMDGVPMLLLTCGIRRDSQFKYQLHDVEQLAVVAPLCKGTFLPQTHQQVPEMVLEAVELANSGCPGPVAIEIPANLYMLEGEYDPAPVRQWLLAATARAAAAGAPDPKQVAEVAAMLAGAKRPLIHVGMGANGAADLLATLAEALGAVVSTTFAGKGAFPEDHPLWLWPGFGTACPAPLKKIADGCDAVLIVGAKMGEVSTASYGVHLPEASAQVDIDASVPGANFPVRVQITADARRFVVALLDDLAKNHARVLPDTTWLRGAVQEAHRSVRMQQARPSEQGRVTPDALFATVQKHFPASTFFATDSGNGTFLAMEHLRLKEPRHFLAPTDYSCMGYCLPACIGAAFAHPGTPVVGFAGDGALLMTGLELLTAAQNKLPVALFVLRDRELGQIASFQRTLTNDAPCSVLPDYNLTALAAVAGVDCRSCDTDQELDAAVQWALAEVRARRPAVVDVAIDYSRKTYFTQGVVKANFGRLPWADRLRMLRRAVARRVF